MFITKKAVSAVYIVLANIGVLHALPIIEHEGPVLGLNGSCIPRRQSSIPVHYVTGTHYEVGYSVVVMCTDDSVVFRMFCIYNLHPNPGRTFGNMIKEFVSLYKPLQNELLAMYAEPEGRKIYEESLMSTEKYFPQYVIELKGMSDGSGVPFHELFLMVLDDTLSRNLNTSVKDKGPIGCTSLIINQLDAQLLGHTEDALSETINNYYIIAAHVIPSEAEMGGVFPAREEKFKALAYAGHLPGYASGHNYHGLVFSINTIFVSKPLRGRIPREFITRAMLSSKADLNEIQEILTNYGVGTADGFNVNLAFLDVPKESRVFYTVEVTPKVDADRSEIYLSEFESGKNSLHTNRLLHLQYPELDEAANESSVSREKQYKQKTSEKDAKSLQDMLEILGSRDDPLPIFIDKFDSEVSTINLGIFDFDNKTWTMWTNEPINNSPLLQLPLTFTDLVSPVEYDTINTIKDIE